jgi:hypothetical protein
VEVEGLLRDLATEPCLIHMYSAHSLTLCLQAKRNSFHIKELKITIKVLDLSSYGWNYKESGSKVVYYTWYLVSEEIFARRAFPEDRDLKLNYITLRDNVSHPLV